MVWFAGGEYGLSSWVIVKPVVTSTPIWFYSEAGDADEELFSCFAVGNQICRQVVTTVCKSEWKHGRVKTSIGHTDNACTPKSLNSLTCLILRIKQLVWVRVAQRGVIYLRGGRPVENGGSAWESNPPDQRFTLVPTDLKSASDTSQLGTSTRRLRLFSIHNPETRGQSLWIVMNVCCAANSSDDARRHTMRDIKVSRERLSSRLFPFYSSREFYQDASEA